MRNKLETMGYLNGFRYLTDGPDVYRNDYADPKTVGVRWFSTSEGFKVFLKAFGPLYHEYGEVVVVHVEP